MKKLKNKELEFKLDLYLEKKRQNEDFKSFWRLNQKFIILLPNLFKNNKLNKPLSLFFSNKKL